MKGPWGVARVPSSPGLRGSAAQGWRAARKAERASQPRFPWDCRGTAIVGLMDRMGVAVGRSVLRCVCLSVCLFVHGLRKP